MFGRPACHGGEAFNGRGLLPLTPRPARAIDDATCRPTSAADGTRSRTVGRVRAIGVICDKTGIQFTAVDSGPTVVEESDLGVPASKTDRGGQLDWLLEEAQALLRRLRPDTIYVKRVGTGKFQAAPERHEVEAIVQVAAHRERIPCRMKTTEQIRASHLPKAKGAYDELLKLPDVAERSNETKRERYLYAISALKDSGG